MKRPGAVVTLLLTVYAYSLLLSSVLKGLGLQPGPGFFGVRVPGFSKPGNPEYPETRKN
jgi:hypothetical protein